jgi:hypothetical protein
MRNKQNGCLPFHLVDGEFLEGIVSEELEDILP